MLLIPNDIILHGKDQVAQSGIHGVIIKVFLQADEQRILFFNKDTIPVANCVKQE